AESCYKSADMEEVQCTHSMPIGRQMSFSISNADAASVEVSGALCSTGRCVVETSLQSMVIIRFIGSFVGPRKLNELQGADLRPAFSSYEMALSNATRLLSLSASADGDSAGFVDAFVQVSGQTIWRKVARAALGGQPLRFDSIHSVSRLKLQLHGK